MRMIHLGGSEARLSVTVEVGSSFEFLVSLGAMGSPGQWPSFDVGAAWFARVEASLSPEFMGAWMQLGRRAGQAWLNLLPLAYEDQTAHEVSGLLSRLRRLSGVELRRRLLGLHLTEFAGIDPDQIDRAASGDKEAGEALLRSRTYFGGEADTVADLMRLDVKATKSLVMLLVKAWHAEFFRAHQKTILPALERDAAAKQLLLETTTPERAIELCTGIVHESMPGLTSVALIPQFAFRPWNIFVQQGEIGVWCYPMADESLDQDTGAPPRQLLRLLKALGDERRLRILKALSTKDSTLQDLTESLGMPRSSVHHHLLALRAAGLVKMTSGRDVRYVIRREALSEPSGLLSAFLQESS